MSPAYSNCHRLTSRLLSVMLLMAVFLYGCDLVEETIFLDRDVRFTFRFDGADITPDGLVLSDEVADFAGRLDGWLKEDIIQASIVSARLERNTPPGQNVNQIFSAVELALENGQRRTVAEQDATPSSREMTFDVTNADITTHARARDGFRGRLQATAADAIEADRQYSVDVVLRISIELEGI